MFFKIESLYVMMVCVMYVYKSWIILKAGELLLFFFVNTNFLLFSPIFSGYDSYGVPDQDGFRTCRPTVSREYLCSPDAQGFSVHRQRWQRPGKQANTQSCKKSLVYQCSRSTQVECKQTLWRIHCTWDIGGPFKWVADLEQNTQSRLECLLWAVNK